MIKIERLKPNTVATIVRNGFNQPVYLAMNITPQELETLKVSAGGLIYTVDEEQIIEVNAEVPVAAPEIPVPAAPQTPATDAGRVPTKMVAGSKTSKA